MSRNAGWFRFYDRMIDSPQVLELSDTEFRLLVSIWCLASTQEVRGTIPFSARALQRRVLPDRTCEQVEEMLAHFLALDLLETTETGFSVSHWDKHQYSHASWAPEARREQKRKERSASHTAVSLVSQASRNVVASGRKTDTDTETETERDHDPSVSLTSGDRDQLSDAEHVRAHDAPTMPTVTNAPPAPLVGGGGGETVSSPEEPRRTIPRRVLVRVAKTARLGRYDDDALAAILGPYHARDPAWLIGEVAAYADWLSDPRAGDPKRKPPAASIRGLHRWLQKADDMRTADQTAHEHTNGAHHAINEPGTDGATGPLSAAQSAAERRRLEYDRKWAELERLGVGGVNGYQPPKPPTAVAIESTTPRLARLGTGPPAPS